MSREALERFLARPALARLWAGARQRLETLGRVGGAVVLTEPSDAEREAVADLLGLRVTPRGPLRVSLTRLERLLRASRFAIGLDEAMALHGGPLRNRVAERIAEVRAWKELWLEVEGHSTLAQHPALVAWLADLRATGGLRRLSDQAAAELLAQSLAVLTEVLARQPRAQPIRLPVLANQVLGASHALDAGTPLATLVQKALARLASAPAPANAQERRALWEGVGVVVDELSNAVLTLGLKPEGQNPTAEALRALAAAGEPMVLTLRQLLRSELTLREHRVVYVCENPAVLAEAAAELGPRAPAMVCLAGIPNQAGRELLGILARGGARLLYHGDFDWAGIRIANALAATLPFEPWRFTARDYRQAASQTREAIPLKGTPVAASWDPKLADAMQEVGVAIEEEAVLGGLLGDWGGGEPAR